MARYTVPNGDDTERPSEATDEAQSAPAGGGSGDDVLRADDPLIGQLKSLYDDVAAEPLPDRLLELLAKLDDAERNR